MNGIKRKLVYVTLYEGIAIAASSTGLSLLSGQGMATAGGVAVIASVIAIVWNIVFNTVFELWESRQVVRARTFSRRLWHAIGFEAGMVCFMLPVFCVVLNVTLSQAFVMQFGLLMFFFVYTFVFNWGFDKVFGVPKSAL